MQTLTSVALTDTPQRSNSEPRLQGLIPIVMVIVGGCEPCAENLVTRALRQGSSLQDIDMTLRIIADILKRDCFAKAVGTDVLARMEKPLAAGWKALRQAMTSTGK